MKADVHTMPRRAIPRWARAVCALSLLLFAFQLWINGQWIVAAAIPTQEAAVQAFLSKLPLGLGQLGPTGVTLLLVVVGTIGLAAAAAARRNMHGAWGALAIGLSWLHGVFVVWYLFTLM